MQVKSFEFPYALKNAIKGLDNDLRLKIVEYLAENGETSYSKILKGLKIKNKGKLTFHLRELSKSGVIERFELLGTKTDEKSFYNVSPFGRGVVNGLMSSLLPTETTLLEPFPIPRAPSVSQMKSNVGGRKT
jgi:DNA-binding HxlR family transcriptional regulator